MRVASFKENLSGTEVRVEIHEDLESINSLSEEWEALAQSLGQTGLMQAPGYFLSYFETLSSSSSSDFVVAVYESSRLVALIPLSRDVKKRLSVAVRLLGFPNTPIPIRSFLWPSGWSEAHFLTLMRRLHDHIPWDVLSLKGLLEDDAI